MGGPQAPYDLPPRVMPSKPRSLLIVRQIGTRSQGRRRRIGRRECRVGDDVLATRREVTVAAVEVIEDGVVEVLCDAIIVRRREVVLGIS